MDQTDLAERAGFSANTIRNMEKAGAGPIAGRSANVHAVQRALEAAGIEFLNHGQPGVRLRPEKHMADEARRMAPILRDHKTTEGTGGFDPQRNADQLDRFADEVDPHGAPNPKKP